ncbi:5'-deoxynucleotidase HDDC2-like [Littorina saxatilis]|uniref:5'-deoxynucleotidase HDDC2 n=1 Tax=Littorina saxatilis TaxID=31220 RepID=A0AAN9G1I1_9CAEN
MASDTAKLFEYMTLIGKLKRVKRTGWVCKGVTDPESVSDHMYRVAMTAFLAPPPLNTDKCVKMALVHDMAECIVGDLTPHDKVSKEEKHRKEEEATKRMCSLVGEPLGPQLFSLWLEYERQETAESRFVKDLDRLEMVVQAFEYEQQEQRPGFLQEFFDSTEGKFSTEAVQGWRQHLDTLRNQSQPNIQSSIQNSSSAGPVPNPPLPAPAAPTAHHMSVNTPCDGDKKRASADAVDLRTDAKRRRDSDSVSENCGERGISGARPQPGSEPRVSKGGI